MPDLTSQPRTPRLSRSLAFDLHGAACRLESSYLPFMDFARGYLADLLAEYDPLPQIDARLYWGASPPQTWAAGSTRTLGRRLLENGVSVLQTELPHLPGLQIETRWTRESLEVEGYYRQPTDLTSRFLNWRAASQESVFIILAYYLVYFPLFVWLNQQRGLHLLHAGAVAWPEGAAVIAGLPGSGKSTLTATLLADPEARLVSDNLLLYDSTRVYAVPEPLHLSPASLEQVSPATRQRLGDSLRDFSHGRHEFRLSPEARLGESRPKSVFITGLASQTETVALPPDQAVERLLAYDNLAREIEAFNQFQAATCLHAPPSPNVQRKRGALRALLAKLDCYELWLSRSAEPQAAARLVRPPARGE